MIKSIIAISLSIALLSFQTGCVSMTVKRMNPDQPNVMEINERVVFGRIIFITHSEKMGDISFVPIGLGLVHMETGKRAKKAVMIEEFVSAHPVTGEPITHRLPKLQSEKIWFENDGTFHWVLPNGNYQIDALAWGHYGKVSAEDFTDPKTMYIYPVKPDKPPECGFVVSPNIVFNVSGDSGALYIGSLLIDMDIKIDRAIEVKNINRIEIKDEYTEAMELLKSRCPSFALTVDKRLMTNIADQSTSFANRRCPTGFEMLLRTIVVGAVCGAILVAPVFIAPAAGPTPTPDVPIGK